jgi:hypothetical protein
MLGRRVEFTGVIAEKILITLVDEKDRLPIDGWRGRGGAMRLHTNYSVGER